MTTTAQKSPTNQLHELERKRADDYADLQRVKRERQEWDDETHALRAEYSAFVDSRPEDWRDGARNPKPDSPSAKLAAKLKQRLATTNPHDAAFVKARAAYHRSDDALNTFLRRYFLDLIEEDGPILDAIEGRFHNAFEELLATTDEYNAAVERVRSLIAAVPEIDGQALTIDPRPIVVRSPIVMTGERSAGRVSAGMPAASSTWAPMNTSRPSSMCWSPTWSPGGHAIQLPSPIERKRRPSFEVEVIVPRRSANRHARWRRSASTSSYLRWKFGVRFSAKAFGPSLASSVWNTAVP